MQNKAKIMLLVMFAFLFTFAGNNFTATAAINSVHQFDCGPYACGSQWLNENWTVYLYGWYNAPLDGIDSIYWSKIPWENCNGSYHVVVTIFVNVTGFPTTWYTSYSSLFPFVSLWMKLWDDEPDECTTDACEGQWELPMHFKEANYDINHNVTSILYYASFVAEYDQWFCANPLLNSHIDQTSILYQSSSWCGANHVDSDYGPFHN
jgi:hypothetical protein